jgi:hypothetical protein
MVVHVVGEIPLALRSGGKAAGQGALRKLAGRIAFYEQL